MLNAVRSSIYHKTLVGESDALDTIDDMSDVIFHFIENAIGLSGGLVLCMAVRSEAVDVERLFHVWDLEALEQWEDAVGEMEIVVNCD